MIGRDSPIERVCERSENSPWVSPAIASEASDHQGNSGVIVAMGAGGLSGMIVGLIAGGHFAMVAICVLLSAFSVWTGWWMRGVVQ